MSKQQQKSSAKLPEAVQKWRDRMLLEFDFASDPAASELLGQAVVQLTRAVQCAEELERSGLFITDRFDQVREHPALKSERQAANQFRVLVKALGIDPEETSPPLKGRRHG